MFHGLCGSVGMAASQLENGSDFPSSAYTARSVGDQMNLCICS